MQIKKQGKKIWIIAIVVTIIILSLLVSINNGTAKSKQASGEINKLETDITEGRKKIEELEAEIEKRDNNIIELEAKVEEAQPWFELSEKERKRKVAEEKEKEEKEKKAAAKKAEEKEKEKLAAEEKAKKKQEEKEKKGYDTGITFEQLARTPDDYEGEKVKFKGKVIQVMEGDDSIQLRVAVNDDYDTIIYTEYDSDIVDSRVLEDDQITVMGISAGLLTYESTMGGNITIPAILVDKIEQ